MYALFETDINNIKRYYFDFFRNKDKVKLILLYQRTLLRHNYHIHTKYISFLSSHEIKAILLDNNIKIMFINGQRIPDIRLTSLCKSIGIKVYYIQHGNHRVFLKRNTIFYFQHLIKSFSYLFDSIALSFFLKKPSYFIYLLMIHVFGRARTSSSIKLLPDKCYYFSNYSKEWHFRNYFNQNSINHQIIGTPDIKKFTFSNVNDDNIITYCYQTLVEDGLVDKKLFLDFYEEMIAWINMNSLSLVIKLHPRISPKLLNILKRRNVNIIHDELPNTQYVIGHYSGLLPAWGLNGNSIISFRFPTIDYPEFITSWVYNIDTFKNLNLEDVSCKLNKLPFYYNNFFKPIVL